MKAHFILLYLAFALAGFLSCDNKENIIKRSSIEFSVAGPSMNGLFRVEEDYDASQKEVTAVYTPVSGNDPAVAFLSYQDHNGLSVQMQLPGMEGLIELDDTHDIFGINILSQTHQVHLISRTLSMDVTLFEVESQSILGITSIDQMRGNFTGIMIFETSGPGGEILEESHIVEGQFEYADY